MDKRALRKKIIALRDRLSPAEIMEKSALIAEKLYYLPAYTQAATIMFFIDFGSEVSTRSMVEETIKRGKVALAPKALPKTRELIPSQILNWEADLAPGAYNIPEPHSDALRPRKPEEIDLLIVPGVAFDVKGNRLGYGGGYYDRFFPMLKPNVSLIALVFDLQIQPEIPVDDWDQSVDIVITEKRIIKTS
jgi:5-formyltetrahydrofolate cyclo-ligase